MAMVVVTLAIGLASFAISARELTASAGPWGVPRGVIAGVAFGAGVATMLDLAQAVVAGAMALGRRRGRLEPFELAKVNHGWYSVGEAVGAGVLRELILQWRQRQPRDGPEGNGSF